MKLSRLAGIFTRWNPAVQAPTRCGWYQVRTEALKGAWWNLTAYFDGKAWWEYGQAPNGMTVRRELQVLQWRGLALEAKVAAALIRKCLPKSAGARRKWLMMANELELPAAMENGKC